MLIADRRRRILDHVRLHGSASIEDLAGALDVSLSTVRRDLIQLQRDGLLARARGGATVRAADTAPVVPPAAPGDASAAAAKQQIGRTAAGLAPDGSTIMVLGGSTTEAMLPHLFHRRLTVVTNGLGVAEALKYAPQVSLVVLGGYLHRDQLTFIGPMTVAAMGAVHVDVMFAGAWGVDDMQGATGNKIIQAGDHEPMLRQVERLVVLADGSKLGRRGPTRLAPVEHIDTLITAGHEEPGAADAIAAAGVRVLHAD